MNILVRKIVETASKENLFYLESGEFFDSAPVAYEAYGTLNKEKSNVILLLHGLSGNTHGASHSANDQPGWWEELIGPGKVLDTQRYFIVIPNILGSCYGTLGPTSINPQTGEPYGPDFPSITVRDMVALQQRFLQTLGIESPSWVIGGSLGGMQALEWAASNPESKSNIISIVAPEKTSAQAIGFNHIMRRAIVNDPNWLEGKYNPENPPTFGMATARAVGMMTYQTEESMERKFARNRRNNRWEIENYLDYQGEKMAASFDANSYLRLIEAMDSHDLSHGRSDYPDCMKGYQGKVFLIGDDSDMLYGISHQMELAKKWQNQGVDIQWRDLGTVNGHDSFLVNFNEMKEILLEIMDEKPSEMLNAGD